MNFYNLNPNERSTFFGQSVYVDDIKGEDFKIELSEVIIENFL